jgi:DNA-binding GntR family transcriptional regulator
MNVGTPVVRKALISLKHEGFVRRVNNRGSFVTKFDVHEIRQLYTIRVEFETLALQWARPLVARAQTSRRPFGGSRGSGNRQSFLERGFEFHCHCWRLCRNSLLTETLERLMSPLFALWSWQAMLL